MGWVMSMRNIRDIDAEKKNGGAIKDEGWNDVGTPTGREQVLSFSTDRPSMPIF